ncbi:protein NATD1-like [Clavelina lepadiformis]|uniref:protein NATD1-like n=1 Tax=Clavelina lepadiformis TaxID=159417 RepID=UPI0040410EEF
MLSIKLQPLMLFLRRMSKLDVRSLSVNHDKKNTEFLIEIKDCPEKAFLSYENINQSTVDLQHTVVPEVFRGQGVGKILAKTALDYVVENNLNMKLTCWYLQKYVKENPLPEYTERLTNP